MRGNWMRQGSNQVYLAFRNETILSVSLLAENLMSRKPRDGSKRAGGGGGGDDVEAILRAAEDELLLNLSIDSHAARGASHSPSSYLDPDLHRRFQSLKSAKPPPLQHRPDKQASRSDDNPFTEDHLFARFSALKGSITVPPSSSLEVGNTDDDDDVDKVIRWAIDAARLDPSPESNVDDDTDDEVESNCGSSSGDDDDDDDDNDNDDGEDNKRGKELKKNKK